MTWESLEHEGPGKYDEEYIDYLRKLLEMMPTYGIKCFVCAHQDVWSRFSGGSGAPGWVSAAYDNAWSWSGPENLGKCYHDFERRMLLWFLSRHSKLPA